VDYDRSNTKLILWAYVKWWS